MPSQQSHTLSSHTCKLTSQSLPKSVPAQPYFALWGNLSTAQKKQNKLCFDSAALVLDCDKN